MTDDDADAVGRSPPGSPKGKSRAEVARDERRAAALRANLRRRKAAGRAPGDPAPAAVPPTRPGEEGEG